MRVLIVKTSSLGDLIHTFPAVTDAARAVPGIDFHWLVEEAFEAVPGWHPAISKTLTISLRRWRRHWRRAWRSGELRAFRDRLRQHPYDLVIDAQGLLKSALPARLPGASVAGYDRRSIREPLASLFYHRRHSVNRDLHAIDRIRALFARVLHYPLPEEAPDYGIAPSVARGARDLVFLHGTTWLSKHWPEPHWQGLARLALQSGYQVFWPWHSDSERLRAERLTALAGGRLLPRMNLTQMRDRLAAAAGVVGVDTGLAHLAAAVETPAVTLYGPTRAGLTGAVGSLQRNLSVSYPCAPCLRRRCEQPDRERVNPPCFATLPPERVWRALLALMEQQQ